MCVCVLQKLQDMDERRIKKLSQGYILFADTERHVMPIIGKCLEGIARAGANINSRNVSEPPCSQNSKRHPQADEVYFPFVIQDSVVLIEQHKSGFERPGDLEFEDYSQGINRASSDSSLGTPKGPLELLGKNRNKTFRLFNKKTKVGVTSFEISLLLVELKRVYPAG